MYKIKADPETVTLEDLVLVFASLFGRLENWQYENLPLSVRHLFAYEHPEEQDVPAARRLRRLEVPEAQPIAEAPGRLNVGVINGFANAVNEAAFHEAVYAAYDERAANNANNAVEELVPARRR